jgi:YbgC/YbaW family acyl-CoA thioester hydrolase
MTELNLEPESNAWIDFQDCDPFGHLNNVKYLNYIMSARTQQLKQAYGFDIYDHTAKTGNGWVVGTTHISYLMPARYNETVRIQTRLLHTDNFRIVPEAVMTSADGKKIHAIAWVEFVYVNVAKGRPVKHEPELAEFLGSLVIPNFEWASEDFTLRVRELQKKFRKQAEVAVA